MMRMVCKHCGFLRSSIEGGARQLSLCKSQTSSVHEYEQKSLNMDETIALVEKANKEDVGY